MPRPKGSKNKKTLAAESAAKAGAAAGGKGHNSGDTLTDEQKQALFFHHRSKIVNLKRSAGTATSDLRNAYKIAKAEGFEKTDFDIADKLEKSEEAEIARRDREIQVASWLGLEIGEQSDMFQDRRSLFEKAYSEGKRAGAEGAPPKPPDHYSPGSDGFRGWTEGWHVGNTAIFNIKAPKADPIIQADQNKPSGPDEFDRTDGNSTQQAGADDSDPDWPDEQPPGSTETQQAGASAQ